MDMGSYIREARRKLKLTQQDVANKLGVTVNFVSLIERNQVAIPLDRLRDLISILKLKKSRLVEIIMDGFRVEIEDGLS